MPKKYSIKNLWYMAAMWLLLWLGTLSTIYFFVIVVNDISGDRLLYINKRQPTEPYEYVIMAAIVAAYALAVWFWRKATFRRKDFVALGERIGVKFNRKRFHYPPYGFIETYRCADGFLGDIYIVARIDFPLWAFVPGWDFPSNKDDVEIPRSKSKNYWTRTRNYSIPYFMKEEARVELFSLISAPFDMDVTIKIEDRKRNIPATGGTEFDEIISNALKYVEYFHARLMLTNECLRMTLIGGSWEGRRFGEKILKGFEIFQTLNSELKGKYQVGDWKDWQVKWNKKEEEFYLEPKGKAL
mgnify:FL=1